MAEPTSPVPKESETMEESKSGSAAVKEWAMILSVGHEEPGYDTTFLVPVDQVTVAVRRLLELDPENRTDSEHDQAELLRKRLHQYKLMDARGDQVKNLVDTKVVLFMRTVAWA